MKFIIKGHKNIQWINGTITIVPTIRINCTFDTVDFFKTRKGLFPNTCRERKREFF